MFDPAPHHNMWNPISQHAYATGFNSGSMVNDMFSAMSHGTMDLAPIQKAETINGYGQLTWLSAKAGLIKCKSGLVISFQLKDFCDQMLTDLTSVLRQGFTLSYQASLNESHEYTATTVAPLYGAEAEQIFEGSQEIDLETSNPTPPNSKDFYDPNMESRAIVALLSMFNRQGVQCIQLSSMHSQMSNCGEDDLFRYVGTSSLKRRQFIERRTHIFILNQDDTVQLQHPAVYLCILRMASHMLRRGGTTAIQSLYEYYTGREMAPEIREFIGDGRMEFSQLITAHPWIFAIFPSRIYVSVRRNLPHFDYPNFVKKLFPKTEQQSVHSAPRFPPHNMMRSMSQQPMSTSFNNDRPLSLFHNSESLAKISNAVPLGSTPRDQWSPLPSQWLRDYTPSLLSSSSIIGTPLNFNNKSSVSVGVQTDNETCACGCSCGGIRLASSRASGGSISPPSAESTGSGGGRLSPKTDEPPMRYYDPFGTDSLVSGITSFSLN